jgi:hypothetical protein
MSNNKTHEPRSTNEHQKSKVKMCRWALINHDKEVLRKTNKANWRHIEKQTYHSKDMLKNTNRP